MKQDLYVSIIVVIVTDSLFSKGRRIVKSSGFRIRNLVSNPGIYLWVNFATL